MDVEIVWCFLKTIPVPGNWNKLPNFGKQAYKMRILTVKGVLNWIIDYLLKIQINFRFVIDSNRAIFMFKDGAKAWEAKNFFLQQDKCMEVTLEGKSFKNPKFDKPGEKNEL